MALSITAAAQSAETAPDWQLESVDGDVVRLSEEVAKQPVVLFFWATWCPYCKALMPHLQSIRLEHGEAVKIVAINFREKGDPVKYIAERGYDFTVLPNGEEVASLYDVWATPGVIVVNRDMQVEFDLRAVPPYKPEQTDDIKRHSTRAAHLAPYWAAELQKTIDRIADPPDNSAHDGID